MGDNKEFEVRTVNTKKEALDIKAGELAVEGEKTAIQASGAFVKRNYTSSEFILLLVYISLVFINGYTGDPVSPEQMGTVQTLVFSYLGIRQVGKAATYLPKEKK